MNHTINRETGGASVIPNPKPRKSIHDHCGCIFPTYNNIQKIYIHKTMVSYGLQSKNRNNNSEGQGVDEIDNVMSKHCHPIEQSYINKNGHRRSSLDTPNTSLDNEDDVLSKSVPTMLPSQLCYSLSDDENEEVVTANLSNNASWHSVTTHNRSDGSTKSYIVSQRQEPNFDREHKESSKTLMYVIGGIVALCAIVYSSGVSVGHISSSNSYDRVRFYTDLSSLGEKYNIDEDSILKLQIGISTIFENQDAGSFIFMYNSNTGKGFHLTDFNEFINEISIAASKFLRNESTPLHYTTLEGTKVDMSDDGEMLCRYKSELLATGVMLVRHLEVIPPRLAMAFHYYCDEYNPLVKKSAILFTLDMASCPQGPDKVSPHTLIEKCLAEKWRDVPSDNIVPLLTRVVSVVIDVTSVFSTVT